MMANLRGFDFPDALHYLMAHDTWARRDDDGLVMVGFTSLGVHISGECSDALAAHAIDRTQLIPEVSEIAGAAVFVERALDPQWATLVFSAAPGARHWQEQ